MSPARSCSGQKNRTFITTQEGVADRRSKEAVSKEERNTRDLPRKQFTSYSMKIENQPKKRRLKVKVTV